MSPRLGSIFRCLQRSQTAAVGTVQILVGLFNIGLGPGRMSTRPGDFSSLGAAYWLGSVFILTGIMSILAGHFPSSVLMGFAMFMNIVGVIFAITGMVLYIVDLGDASLLWICQRGVFTAGLHDDSCRNVALFAQNLLTTMDHTLVVLAVLLLLVSIRFAVLGIAFLTGDVDEQQDVRDAEILPSLLEEVPLRVPAASTQPILTYSEQA